MYKRIITSIILISAGIISVSCGGMVGSSMKNAAGSPACLTYSITSAVYTKDAAIINNVPKVTGIVTLWTISPEMPEGLIFDSATGIITGTPVKEQSATEYLVRAENHCGSATSIISITVNLEPPKALSYTTTSAVYSVGESITSNTPTVTGTVTYWSISPALPAGLVLDSKTGIISGTSELEQTAQIYIITAGNKYGSTTVNISITINHEAPKALSYSASSAVYTKNAVISDNIPTVTGTVTSWSVYPSLPAGLTLNTSTGVISGTPINIQSAESYTITASNSDGYTTSVISIIVNDAAPDLLSYASNPAVYTKGAVITNNIPTVAGTVTSWSVYPSLPPGLTLNTSTGVISGTPINIQSAASYTITASNSGGYTTSVISIIVNDAAPSLLSYSTNPAVYIQGSVIANNMPTVTGTVTSWSITPSLPDGLILNTTTGVISGTPETVHALTSYTITAANSGGSTTAIITMIINSGNGSGEIFTLFSSQTNSSNRLDILYSKTFSGNISYIVSKTNLGITTQSEFNASTESKTLVSITADDRVYDDYIAITSLSSMTQYYVYILNIDNGDVYSLTGKTKARPVSVQETGTIAGYNGDITYRINYPAGYNSSSSTIWPFILSVKAPNFTSNDANFPCITFNININFDNSPQYNNDLAVLREKVKSIIENSSYKIDKTRLYACGYSAGGCIVMQIANDDGSSLYNFTAVAAIGISDWVGISYSSNLGNTDIWLFYGENDTYYGKTGTKVAYENIPQTSGDHFLTEMVGLDHSGSYDPPWLSPYTFMWLLSK